MQHVFEFIVKKKEDPTPIMHRRYVTQSGRKSKATKKILMDLHKNHSLTVDSTMEFYIRQLR